MVNAMFVIAKVSYEKRKVVLTIRKNRKEKAS